MKEVDFKSLNLKVNDSVKTITINGIDIEIKNYLPIEDKMDLIQIALQQAENATGYDSILVDIYFHLYLVYFYTNIKFTEEEKAEPLKLFDILDSNNIISIVASSIPSTEFEDMKDYIYNQLENNIKFKTSLIYILNILMDKIKDATKYLNDVDYEKIAEIIKTNFVENGDNI